MLLVSIKMGTVIRSAIVEWRRVHATTALLAMAHGFISFPDEAARAIEASLLPTSGSLDVEPYSRR